MLDVTLFEAVDQLSLLIVVQARSSSRFGLAASSSINNPNGAIKFAT